MQRYDRNRNVFDPEKESYRKIHRTLGKLYLWQSPDEKLDLSLQESLTMATKRSMDHLISNENTKV